MMELSGSDWKTRIPASFYVPVDKDYFTIRGVLRKDKISIDSKLRNSVTCGLGIQEVLEWFQSVKPMRIILSALDQRAMIEIFKLIQKQGKLRFLSIRAADMWYIGSYIKECEIGELLFTESIDSLDCMNMKRYLDELPLLRGFQFIVRRGERHIDPELIPEMVRHKNIKSISFRETEILTDNWNSKVPWSKLAEAIFTSDFKGKVRLITQDRMVTSDYITATNNLLLNPNVTNLDVLTDIIDFTKQIGQFKGRLKPFRLITVPPHITTRNLDLSGPLGNLNCKSLTFKVWSESNLAAILCMMEENPLLTRVKIIWVSPGHEEIKKDLTNDITTLSETRMKAVQNCIETTRTLIALRRFRPSWLNWVPKEIVLMLSKFLFDTFGHESWYN